MLFIHRVWCPSKSDSADCSLNHNTFSLKYKNGSKLLDCDYLIIYTELKTSFKFSFLFLHNLIHIDVENIKLNRFQASHPTGVWSFYIWSVCDHVKNMWINQQTNSDSTSGWRKQGSRVWNTSKQASLDEVSLEIGDVTLFLDDGELTKISCVEEVLGMVQV